ncbi:hypothetical protein FGIG_03662, partial [Fasciola gigantica]
MCFRVLLLFSCKQCTECRPFYFNKQNKEYMLSLYVDTTTSWTFFTRTVALVLSDDLIGDFGPMSECRRRFIRQLASRLQHSAEHYSLQIKAYSVENNPKLPVVRDLILVHLSCTNILMAHAHNLLLVMWFLELQLCCALCPNGFDEVDTNICLIGFQQAANFCQANELCETEGLKRGLRLFVPGLNAFKISRTILSKNKVFTSITALLNRSTVLKDGWQVGDPGFAGY